MAAKNSKPNDRSAKAAALLREQREKERRRNMFVGAGVALALMAIVAVMVVVLTTRDTEVDAPEAGRSDYGLTIGDPDAPNKVVIYEDFLCPFCGELEGYLNDDLTALADDGKVFVEYRPFNLLSSFGDYSARAASAFAVVLDESGAEVAKEYHDLLFEEQPEEGDEPYPDADWLVEKAVEAGADEAAVRPGIEAGVSDWVNEATQQADDAGVDGTPTVLLNGTVFTDYRNMQDLADNLVEAVS